MESTIIFLMAMGMTYLFYVEEMKHTAQGSMVRLKLQFH